MTINRSINALNGRTEAIAPLSALCAWSASASDFGPTARNRAAGAIVDVMATMIAGKHDASTAAVVAAVDGLGDGPCLAFGAEKGLSSPWAALVNGTAAHALDFDDNFAPAFTHASAVLVPALLSLVHERQGSGIALIEAYIVGLELQGRIGRLMQPSHYERGWHSTSTIGAIGTAGACARLMGASADQILTAMSVATSMAGGSKLQFGSMMKPVHAGLAAKNAVLAARLAMTGLSADPDPFSASWGFAALTGQAAAEPGVMMAGLNEELEIETSGLHAKRFPCCGAVHRNLDALKLVLQAPGVSTETIDRIELLLPDMARQNLRFDRPGNEMEARFSGTYCTARLLLDGNLLLRHFTAGSVREERVTSWLPRIRLTGYDNALMNDGADFEAVTRAFLKDGRVVEAAVSHPKGSPQNPLSQDDLRQKFHACCDWAGCAAAAGTLFRLASSLATADDTAAVMQEIARNITGK
ncbi:MmgE/PrpD family protein [Rhizobium sp. RU36D]|uniref:MmgE/PrpD family protein n=1 Tax=Rhizobium sp. RU36D TaxID=1907415 RepID=UPI0009D87E1D|nr:MmgE/PrpD family protein [Rhizobium sp. RU36D]SMC95117.1 2-methylcitrate dehydratase PrpD [Rhizobium sp. RU36D]